MKRIVVFIILLCSVFTLSSCEIAAEVGSEFSNQLEAEMERAVEEGLQELKESGKKIAKKEVEKMKLKIQVEFFQNKLKNVNVNKKNRAEMMYVMESILHLCKQNGLTYEAMQIEALYNMSTLMTNAQSLYEDIDELDSGISDVSSLITGDYAQLFADKAVDQAMKKWEKEVDKSIDDAIEGTLRNIAENDKIWEVITEKYLKENGYKK